MTIEVAGSAGFCFGVDKAVKVAEQVLKDFKIAYATGDIIHNPSVMKKLSDNGLRIVEDISEIPEESHLIVRAHGEPPETYQIAKENNITLHDATCSYVHYIHELAGRLSSEGKKVIIFGRAEHPETLGINGWCRNEAVIIEKEEDARSFEDNGSDYCLLSQTTMNHENYDKIFDILNSRVKSLTKYDTICVATQKRQQETVELAKKADIMIVVGGRNSSNTRKLYDICLQYCKKTYWVEQANELSPDTSIGYNYIGITAGASTPDWIVKEVLEYMSEVMKQGGASEFEKALEESLVEIRNGQLVKGKIISMNDKEVFVDVGFKIDGTISISEFPADEDGNPKVNIGDEVEAIVSKVRDSEGVVHLSKKRADYRKAFDKINELANEGETFKATVKEVVKGGLICDVFGVDGFMPASQISTRFVKNLNKYVGRKLKVRIIENDRRRKKLILSARVIIEEENERLEKEVWSKLELGSIINGRIKSLTNFGAFVDVGGIDGLLHISEMSWHKIDHPSEIFEIGQDVEVYVKEFDKDAKKISLGYRREEDNPWFHADEKYASGNVVSAKIVRILPFGAFVNLEQGIDALVHISQISNKRLETPADVLKEGMVVEVAIIDIDTEKRKINASIKAVNPIDPEVTEEEKAAESEKEADDKPRRTPRKRKSGLRSGNKLPTSHTEDFNNTLGDLFAGLAIDEEAEEEVSEEPEAEEAVEEPKETEAVEEKAEEVTEETEKA